MELGWPPCQAGLQLPFGLAAGGADLRMQDGFAPQLQQQQAAQQQFDQQEVTDLASRTLRVLLGSDSLLLHPQLRSAVLGSSAGADSSSRRKCLLEVALASLVEQGLVVRQGYGAFASLSVPDVVLPRAEALAYSEFPDEGQLTQYSNSSHPQHHQNSGGGIGGGAPHRPASCLNRMRRHPAASPRQFGGRMPGIEKAGGRRSSKRGVGDDISIQLQKKMRMQDSSNSSGCGDDGYDGGGGGGPYSPGGFKAMSP